MTASDPAQIVRAVLLLARRLRAARPDGTDLSLSGLGLLATLHRDGPLPAARLAQAEGLEPQSLSRLIAALDKAGFIRRERDPADRRALLIELTGAGRQALARDIGARRAWLEDAMARHLSPEERAILQQAAGPMLRLAASKGGPE
ncbi:MAG TPA: MarR family transcriptional regulator [Ferrovibrio sp.]|uniref:MarR family winged helix-turn-helix transcriptional regulator n=1 Tax=Ferrovibrio sp. TaxID=1917215 RepID=UPI002ED5FC29